MYVVFRRLVLLALVGGAGFAGYTIWRRRTDEAGHVPEWPPLTTAPAASQDSEPAHGDSTVADPPLDASVPAAPPTPPDGATWVPAVEGECPIEYPIKANDNSGIYHVPGGRFYDRTRAERCYGRAADADADGYRPAKA